MAPRMMATRPHTPGKFWLLTPSPLSRAHWPSCDEGTDNLLQKILVRYNPQKPCAFWRPCSTTGYGVKPYRGRGQRRKRRGRSGGNGERGKGGRGPSRGDGVPRFPPACPARPRTPSPPVGSFPTTTNSPRPSILIHAPPVWDDSDKLLLVWGEGLSRCEFSSRSRKGTRGPPSPELLSPVRFR